jgi:hypothetical protein
MFLYIQRFILPRPSPRRKRPFHAQNHSLHALNIKITILGQKSLMKTGKNLFPRQNDEPDLGASANIVVRLATDAKL